jgi:hypothetical protein
LKYRKPRCEGEDEECIQNFEDKNFSGNTNLKTEKEMEG